ncbi:MAG: ORF6C domain-containing protein [Methylomonas sp.]
MADLYWKRFQNYFKVNSYKFLPAEKFDEASQYLEQKRIEYRNGLTTTVTKDLALLDISSFLRLQLRNKEWGLTNNQSCFIY